jgi:hypothetical protein
MVIFAIVSVVLAWGPKLAAAATPAPRWAIRAVALPTAFSSADTSECNKNRRCDAYSLAVTNVGAGASSGAIVIKDSLPVSGVVFISTRSLDLRRITFEEAEAVKEGLQTVICTSGGLSVECSYEESVAAGETITVTIYVATEESSAPLSLEDRAEVEGGGAPGVATTAVKNMANVDPTKVEFGIADFGVGAYGPGGETDTQAGDHPQLVTTSFDFTDAFNPAEAHNPSYIGIEEPKTITVELPLGLIGNPQAAGKCPEVELPTKPELSSPGFTSSCPTDSRIGTVVLLREDGNEGGQFESSQVRNEGRGGSVSALYNLVPEDGYAAVFGFRFIAAPVLLYASVVPSPQGYRLRVSSSNLPHGVNGYKIIGAMLSFFGAPSIEDGVFGGGAVGFFRNPTSCSNSPEALAARIEVNSWVRPGRVVAKEVPVYSEIGGCNMLQFDPELVVRPESSQLDTPSGYEVDLKVPQSNLFGERATPDLKDVALTLAAGVSISPSAGLGLEGCTEAQIDPLGTELGEGHLNGNGSRFDDGLEHASPGHCPEKSQIGDVELKTPLLEAPLRGHVYVAQPACGGSEQPQCTEQSAANGELYGLYLEISGSGVIMKLHGEISVDPHTGVLTILFANNPQLPFEDLKIELKGGQQAVLANPQTCGQAETTSELEPWSARGSGPNATPSSSSVVTGCSGPIGLNPGFSAGATRPLGAVFSPFTMTISRKDGEQNLASMSVTLPPGAGGLVSKVPQCPEPQASLGTCPESSRVGTVNAAIGPGSEPLWISGPVYFTGPYKGAPFGLSIVIPAQAGPFNLGNVVVRASVGIEPHTAQVIVTSDRLPQIRHGVPLRLKELNVAVDRPEFIFNPTNCSPLRVIGTVSGEMPDGSSGATVTVSNPFTVTGCKNLPFKPSFSVSTRAEHSKGNGASLHVALRSLTGEANIGLVKVELPKRLPARLTTLNLACLEIVFAVNPASCPAGSIVGTASASTPVLPVPLSGPAYFVSHGGAKFPELVMVLQGDGVTLDLAGETFISPDSTTSSTFRGLPDLPVRRFDLALPSGYHSVLAGNGNFCTGPMYMPTVIKGQNGTAIKLNTKVAVSGCKPAVTVVHHNVEGATVTIVASVPAPGRLRATGRGCSGDTTTVRKAGRATVVLHLTKDAQRFLSLHPARKLRVRVSLRFKPVHGSQLATAVTVLLG